MAVLALGVAGAALTSSIGLGASAGWLGGVMLGNLLFGSTSKSEGPRLDDLSVQTSTYGAPIPLVYGTMRLSGNVIWATDLKETRSTSSAGGKGGGKAKQTSYSYSVSFAVGLCTGPVSSVRRVWADTKLIYDATAGNSASTEKYPSVLKVYLGDEDQLPDSTMEMHLGAGNVPAYRGLCYLVFTDLQLADFANRIPDISAEVVTHGGLQVDSVILPRAQEMWSVGGHLDRPRGTLIGWTGSWIYKYDLINNTLLSERPLALDPLPDYPSSDNSYGYLAGVDSQGYFYHATDAAYASMRLAKRHPDTLALVAVSAQKIVFSVSGSVARDKIFVFNSREVYDTDLQLVIDLGAIIPKDGEAVMCDDAQGNYWQCGRDTLRRVSFDLNGTPQLTEYDITSIAEGSKARSIFWDDFSGHIYFTMPSKRLVKWHPDTGYAGHLDDIAIPWTSGAQADSNMPIKGKLWAAAGTRAMLVDLVRMRVETDINLAPYAPTYQTHYGGCYEKFTHSVVIMSGSGQIKYPLERYGAEDLPLSGVLADLCTRAGIPATQVITGAVSQSLGGYVVSRRMPAREALEPLLGAYFIDAVESDGVLSFIPRGSETIARIPYDDLGTQENGGGEILRLTETRTQDVELPQRLDVIYLDPERDYQTNTQHARRASEAVGTRETQTSEVSIALTASEAKRIAERTLFTAWVERTRYQLSLPPKWLCLDPADVVTVEMPDRLLTLRLTKTDFGANNCLSCEAVAEDEVVYLSSAAGTSAPVTTAPVTQVPPLGVFLMDVPMLRLEDNSLGLTYAFAMKDNTGTAGLYRSPDTLAWEILGTGDDGPVFGWAATKLNDTASPWTWDRTNTVKVTLIQGSLDSKIALEVLDGANAALLGDEIIQWQNAELQEDGSYLLSTLLRGRRGTEHHTSTHATGDRFIVLARDGLYRAALPQSQLNITSSYRALLNGGDWDDTPILAHTFKGNSLRCLSPVHICGTRDGEGNLTLSWIRRTRWYGEWLDGTDVPLFEESERYEVDIMSGDTVKRTLSVSTPQAIYTATDQISDFGTLQPVLNVCVTQLNAVTGRGQGATASL